MLPLTRIQNQLLFHRQGNLCNFYNSPNIEFKNHNLKTAVTQKQSCVVVNSMRSADSQPGVTPQCCRLLLPPSPGLQSFTLSLQELGVTTAHGLLSAQGLAHSERGLLKPCAKHAYPWCPQQGAYSSRVPRLLESALPIAQS